jgi:hypothetical protein
LQVSHNKILLNNHQQSDSNLQKAAQPLRTILNNLHDPHDDETDEEAKIDPDCDKKNIACNKCKEQLLLLTGHHNSNNNNIKVATAHTTARKKLTGGGCVNLAFVDAAVESSSWYQPRLSRQLAVKLLADCPVGTFVVRHSQTQQRAGCLALTVRVPRSLGTVLHYLVLVDEEGFRIKGLSKVFKSLGGLVVHHSVMKESLPCRLRIEDDSSCGSSSGSAADSDRESDFADLDSDPEYPGIITRLREQLSQ